MHTKPNKHLVNFNSNYVFSGSIPSGRSKCSTKISRILWINLRLLNLTTKILLIFMKICSGNHENDENNKKHTTFSFIWFTQSCEGWKMSLEISSRPIHWIESTEFTSLICSLLKHEKHFQWIAEQISLFCCCLFINYHPSIHSHPVQSTRHTNLPQFVEIITKPAVVGWTKMGKLNFWLAL